MFGRASLCLVTVFLVACGARSQLRTPRVDASIDARTLDAIDAPPVDVPITPPCSWPPIADAVMLSDGTESWALGDAVVGESVIYAAWYPRPGGAVWVTRVGFGGERLTDPHAHGGLFADDAGWLHLARTEQGAAAFASWRDTRTFEEMSPDTIRVESLVEHSDWPQIVSVVRRDTLFDALAIEGGRIEAMILGGEGIISGYRGLAIPGGASAAPTRAVAADGSFAVLWTEGDAAGRRSLHRGVFDVSGRPRGASVSLAPQTEIGAYAVTLVDSGFLAVWSTAATSAEGPALWSALIGFDGDEIEAPARIANAGIVPDRGADIALTGAAHGAIAAFGATQGGVARLVVVPLDSSGHASRPPMQSRMFASLTRAIAMETRDGAAIVFEAAPSEAPRRAAIWSIGFTCLR